MTKDKDYICGENGFCPQHGVEIERRKSDRREIDNIKEEIKVNRRHIGTLLTFKNICIGVSLLGTIVLTGSYVFTNNHIEHAEKKYGAYNAKIEGIDARVDTVMTRLAAVDERYMGLTTQISTLNGRLSELINLINEERRIQRVHLENYDQQKREGNDAWIYRQTVRQ